jgi:hypothetical protein
VKIRPKQNIGYLPLDIVLPGLWPKVIFKLAKFWESKIPVKTPKSMMVAVLALIWPGLGNPDPGNQR